MQYGHVPGIAKSISRVVQGTMMVSSKELETSFALLDSVFELGCNAFDTAHVYGGGDNERTVGRWVNTRGLREQVVIIGKGAHHNQDRKRVTPYDITSDIHDSLARFGFDYIDLYLLHRDDPSVPVGPIIDVLNEHLHAGRIGAFGASNWEHSRINAANEYARSNDLQPFIASSPNYSLADQVKAPWADCVTISGPQNAGAREWYQAQQIPLFTWSSLAGGFFSGRFDRHNLDAFDTYFDKLVVDCYCSSENFLRLDRVKTLAQAKGLAIPQIALAFVLCQPLDIYALTGARTRDEFLSNAAAADVKLSPQEVAWLDLASETY